MASVEKAPPTPTRITHKRLPVLAQVPIDVMGLGRGASGTAGVLKDQPVNTKLADKKVTTTKATNQKKPVVKRERKPAAKKEQAPAVKKERKPVVKNDKKPVVEKERTEKEVSETPAETPKKIPGVKRKNVHDEQEDREHAATAVKKPRKGGALTSVPKATIKRKSTEDVEEVEQPAVKKQRTRKTTSTTSKNKTASRTPHTLASKPLEREEKEQPRIPEEPPRWIDVIINQGEPNEEEHRLPFLELAERCKLFSKKLNDPNGWQALNVDPADGKTPILALKKAMDPTLFDAVIHALTFSPRYSLRDVYRTTCQTTSSDGEIEITRCTREVDWSVQNLMEAYYIAEYLGSPNMCDVLMTQMISEHCLCYTVCDGRCALDGQCGVGGFCWDPAKMDPIFEFFEKTEETCRGRDYFMDFYLLHRDVLRAMNRANPTAWSNRPFWLQFVDALDDPMPGEYLTKWPDADFCLYHEHQTDDSAVCPCEVQKADRTAKIKQDVFQDIIDAIRSIEESSSVIGKERDPIDCEGVFKTPQEVVLELLEHAKALVACAQEIHHRIASGADHEQHSPERFQETQPPLDKYRALYQGLMDETCARWSGVEAKEALRAQDLMSVRQKLNRKTFLRGRA